MALLKEKPLRRWLEGREPLLRRKKLVGQEYSGERSPTKELEVEILFYEEGYLVELKEPVVI